MCAGRVEAVRGCWGGVGGWWWWAWARGCGGGLGRRLSLRKVAGAYLIDSALDAAFAGSHVGGDGSDGDTCGKCSDDCAVGVVGGCGLDCGAGDGCVLGAADGGGGDAGQDVNHALRVVVAVCVGGVVGELAAVGRLAVLAAANGICGLRTGSVQNQLERARLVGPFVALQRRAHSEPRFRRNSHCIVLRLYPLRAALAAAPADCPRHFLQGDILFFAVHVVPLSAGALRGSGGLVGGFEAYGKLGTAAGFWELCDGGAVEAPRLAHDLRFSHGYDLLCRFDGMGRGRFGARCGSARVSGAVGVSVGQVSGRVGRYGLYSAVYGGFAVSPVRVAAPPVGLIVVVDPLDVVKIQAVALHAGAGHSRGPLADGFERVPLVGVDVQQGQAVRLLGGCVGHLGCSFLYSPAAAFAAMYAVCSSASLARSSAV